MDYDQRVMIKILFSEGLDGHQIVDRLDLQFHDHDHSCPSVQFWI
jgi:hypothetical protein